MALESSTMTTYIYTTSLLQFQNVASIMVLEAANSILEQWSVFLMVLRGPPNNHRSVYNIVLIIGAAE